MPADHRGQSSPLRTRTAREPARLPPRTTRSPSPPIRATRTNSSATSSQVATTAVPDIYCSLPRYGSPHMPCDTLRSRGEAVVDGRRFSHAESSRSVRPPRPVIHHSASLPQPHTQAHTSYASPTRSSSPRHTTNTATTTSAHRIHAATSRITTAAASSSITGHALHGASSRAGSTGQRCRLLRTPPLPPATRSALPPPDKLSSTISQHFASVSARLVPTPSSVVPLQHILRQAQQQQQQQTMHAGRTLMVGHAVVNPNATLAPPVQRGVRQIVQRVEPIPTDDEYSSYTVVSSPFVMESGAYLRCKERPTCLPTVILTAEQDTLAAAAAVAATTTMAHESPERTSTPLGTAANAAASGSMRARTRLRLGCDAPATSSISTQQQQQQQLTATRTSYRRWSGSLPELEVSSSTQELMSTTLFHSMTGDLTRMPHFAPYAGYDNNTSNNNNNNTSSGSNEEEIDSTGSSSSRHHKSGKHHHAGGGGGCARHGDRVHNILPTSLQQALSSIGIMQIQITRSSSSSSTMTTRSTVGLQGGRGEEDREDRSGMRALRRLYHTTLGEDVAMGSRTRYASRASRTMTVQPTATMPRTSSTAGLATAMTTSNTARLLQLSKAEMVQRQLDKLRNPYIQASIGNRTTPVQDWEGAEGVRDHVLSLLSEPTAPTIAFLDALGQPVRGLPVLHYRLDPTTLQLGRNASSQTNTNGVGYSSGASHRGVCAAQTANTQACVAVGVRVRYDGLQHRIAGLVGLLPGAAESVGLQRVMVYRVSTSVPEMFCVPPRIEQGGGDLVLQFNARCLKSRVSLTITACDAAAVDRTTLRLMQSVNTLTCVVDTEFRPCAAGEPQRRAPQRRPSCVQVPCTSHTAMGGEAYTSADDERGAQPYAFPHTNPCSLLYGDCSQNAHELLRTSPTLSLSSSPPQPAATSASAGVTRPAQSMDSSNGTSHGGSSSGSSGDGVDERQLRQPLTRSLWYETSKVHMVCMLLRLVDWQRRFSHLFRDAAEEAAVYDAQHRSRFKKRAWQELQNFRRTEQHPLSSRNFTPSGENDDEGESEGCRMSPTETQWPHKVTALPSARDKSRHAGSVQRRLMQTLRHLLLCLLLEPSRASPRLFFDVVDLCAQLAHHALLRTTSCTGGSAAGLAKAATQLRAPCADYYYHLVQQGGQSSNTMKRNGEARRTASRPTSPRDGAAVTFAFHTLFAHAAERQQQQQQQQQLQSSNETRTKCSHASSVISPSPSRTASPSPPRTPPPLLPSLQGSQGLTENERVRLCELEDALNVTLTACMLIGAFDAAAVYATQRLHVRYLREAGGSRAGCLALRDVVEALYFYGDYDTALSVARDLLTQTGQYYSAQSSEQAEAELLYCLCYLADEEMTMMRPGGEAAAAARRAAVLERLHARFRTQQHQQQLSQTGREVSKETQSHVTSSPLLSLLRHSHTTATAAATAVTTTHEQRTAERVMSHTPPRVSTGAADTLPLLLRVQLRYVWAAAHAEAELGDVARPGATSHGRRSATATVSSSSRPSAAAVRAVVEEAIALCEKGNAEGITAERCTSACAEAGTTPTPTTTITSTQDTCRARHYTRTMKLLLRFFLGGLLCKLHAIDRGQAVVHAVVPQLVASAMCEDEAEGPMRTAATTNATTSSTSSNSNNGGGGSSQKQQLPTAGLIVWSVTALWRLWACPSEHSDTVGVLRRLARQLTRLKGPYYLLAGLMHICVARETHDRAPPYALHLTQRALSVMRRTLHTRSVILHLARGLALRVHLGFGHWRYALEQVGHQVSAMHRALSTSSGEGDSSSSKGAQEATVYTTAISTGNKSGEGEALPALHLAAAEPVLHDVVLTLLACPAAQTTLHIALDVFLPCLQACVRQHEQRCGSHDASLVRPLCTLAMGYYLLSCWAQAEPCLERAVRIVDGKGMLLSEEARALLRPSCTLPPQPQMSEHSGAVQVSKDVWCVQRREKVLSGMNGSRPAVLALAQLLFALAAVQEAKLRTVSVLASGEAMEKVERSYGQALALLESVGLQHSLCAVRVYTALARLAYTMAYYRVAYAWGYKAQRAVHAHFRHMAREVGLVSTLMHAIEYRVYETEGTYLMVQPSYLTHHNNANSYDHEEEDDVQIW